MPFCSYSLLFVNSSAFLSSAFPGGMLNSSVSNGGNSTLSGSNRSLPEGEVQSVWQKWQRLWPLFLGFGLLGVGGYLLFIHYRRPTAIHRIEVSGAHYLRRAEILELAGLKEGRIYPYARLQEIDTKLEAHPVIEKAEREFQGTTLRLFITEKKCLALIRDTKEGKIFEIDKNLTILSSELPRCSKIPFIHGHFSRIGDRFEDSDLHKLAAILLRLQESYPELGERISELRHNADQSVSLFLLNSRLRVNLPVDVGPEEIKKLYASVAYFEHSGLKSGILDLRGSEAVLLPGVNEN